MSDISMIQFYIYGLKKKRMPNIVSGNGKNSYLIQNTFRRNAMILIHV